MTGWHPNIYIYNTQIQHTHTTTNPTNPAYIEIALLYISYTMPSAKEEVGQAKAILGWGGGGENDPPLY